MRHNPLQSQVDIEQSIALAEAVDGLPDRLRRVYGLWKAGYTNQEIGHKLGIDRETVKRSKHAIILNIYQTS